MLSKLVAASLLVLQGAAFLLTPEINGPHALDTTDARKLSIATTCSKCPFPETSDSSTSWLSGVDSYMLLNLTTEGDKLFVNQKEIYPDHDKSLDLHTVLVRKADEHFSHSIATGYVLELLRTPESATDPGPELLTFYLTPVQVGGLPAAADTLYIPVIKTVRGNLVIVNSKVEAAPAPRIAWRRCGNDVRCWRRLLMARIAVTLRAARARAAQFADRMSSAWKGCHGQPSMQGGSRQHGYGYGYNGHRHGHHMHRKPTFARAFTHALHFVIIPAIVGLCISLVVCYVGSLVGYCFVTLWRLIRGQRNTQRPSLDSAQENGEAGEKEALMTAVEYSSPDEDRLHGHIQLPVEKE